MSLDKKEYILRSLQKIAHKKWELFIITRILHKLDDDEIEFVTQQYVRRKDGTRALTDLYFPQLSLHLEIDEPFHDKEIIDKDEETTRKKQREADNKRERDIIEETNHEIDRIKIAQPDDTKSEKCLKEVCSEIDAFIVKIRDYKKQRVAAKKFVPWDFETRYSAAPVIKRGKVSIEDNVVFKTQVEALRCFGFKGKGWQRGVWEIPSSERGADKKKSDLVWFPRLYKHGNWDNQLINEGTEIREKATTEEGIKSIAKQRKDNQSFPDRKHIVFAKACDSLGFNLLRYVGTFVMNTNDNDPKVLRFNRVATTERVRVNPEDDPKFSE